MSCDGVWSFFYCFKKLSARGVYFGKYDNWFVYNWDTYEKSSLRRVNLVWALWVKLIEHLRIPVVSDSGENKVRDSIRSFLKICCYIKNRSCFWKHTESGQATVHSICSAGVALEDQTITEFVDCGDADISELVLTITAKNGSGSFHYEIVTDDEM